MASQKRKSSDVEPRPGPSCSPPKHRRSDPESTTPDFSLGRPSLKGESVFANHLPRLSTDEIQDKIFEELLKMHRRKQIPSSMLDHNPMFSLDHLRKICGQIVAERETKLVAEYNHIVDLKLSEQRETFTKLAIEQIKNQFKDADDPSYMT